MPGRGGRGGERGEGRVPWRPGTGGRCAACSSSGPCPQAGWPGDLLRSACPRRLPRRGAGANERGAPPRPVTTSMWSPRRLLSPGNFGAPRAGGTRGEGLRARRGGGGRAPGREETGGERGRRVTLPLESSEGGEWTVARQSTIERAPMPSPQGDSQPAATGSLRSHASPCADAPAGDAGHTKGSGACTLPRAGDPGGSREARLGSDAGSVCARRKHVYKRDVRGLSALDSTPPCWSPPRTTNGSFSNPRASSNLLPCLMKSLYLKYNSIILKLLA